ncbi:PQQ-binding-like beta-propeller repeat protein [Gordonia polyisoprenivorans]|uniref:PQQ-binding-like beta-propeller repeat protein n=1 Tax=Gordonia polyisoprenivorans TaxID=84595 RepID=UPI001F0B316E|nr:PQQ-binding-like beta-propeller repeat protein [Gordonia polyisoprenivorans]
MTTPVDPPEHPAVPDQPATDQPATDQPATDQPAPGYPQPGYPPQPYPGPGYAGPGNAAQGYPAQGYQTPAYPASAYQAPTHQAPGYPWPAPPAPGGPTPTGSSGRTWLWVALGSVVFVVVIAIVAVIVVAGSDGGSDSATAALAPGDDTVHAEESGSIPRPPSNDVASMPAEPSITWSSGPALPGWWGASTTALVLGSREYSPSVTVIDAATGRSRFVHALPPGRFVDLCAATDTRIACATATKDAPSETLTVLDARTGARIADTPLPPGPNGVQSMHAVGDRFVMTYGSSTSPGAMIATDSDGTVTWSGRGSGVAADQPIIVQADSPPPNSDEVSLLRASDGKQIVSLSRSSIPRFPTVPFTVYQGGVAVINPQGTGTDFYSLDGTKTGSLQGWAPAAQNDDTGAPAPPAPILGRIAADLGKTSHIVGAANPRTGHIIWRRTGSEFNAVQLSAVMAGDLLGLRLRQGGGSTAPSTNDGNPNPDGPVQLFDPLTGAVRSVPITIGMTQTTTDVLSTDGTRLITSRGATLTAYDLATGAQAWQLQSDGQSLRSAGSHVFGTGGSDGISSIGP